MCLAYEEEEKLNALTPDEWAALRDETIAYVETLRASGSLVGLAPNRWTPQMWA